MEHARIKQVSPDYCRAITAIASQSLLLYIAIQIAEVKVMINRVLVGQHNDRIAEIMGGINLYKSAIALSVAKQEDALLQRMMLSNALQSLNIGMEKASREIMAEIERAPEPTVSFFDNWPGSDKASEVASHFRTIFESY